MELDQEMQMLDLINHCGFALFQYALSLPNCASFTNTNGRWVCSPNYVTLQVHHKRANNIRISLRGNPEEYEHYQELPLKPGMAGYSECSFESPAQMFAAISYIRRAWQIFNKGRGRTPTRPITIGE